MPRNIKTVMPVEAMIGKLSPVKATKWKRYNNPYHFYVGFQRTYSNINRFMSRVNARSTQPQAEEISKWVQFRIVAQAVNDALADPAKDLKAKAKWKAQTHFVTVRGMVFAAAWELYDNGQVIWGDYWD